MKFLDMVRAQYEQILEQDMPVTPEINVPSPGAAPAATTPEQPAPEQPKQLTPEGEVFLVNLLRKALFMNPGDIELKSIKDLPETDEKNASDILKKIVEIMQVSSVDLNVNPLGHK